MIVRAGERDLRRWGTRVGGRRPGVGDGEFVVVVGLSDEQSTLVRASTARPVDVRQPRGQRHQCHRTVPPADAQPPCRHRDDLPVVQPGQPHDRAQQRADGAAPVPTWRTLLGLYPKDDVEIAMQALERPDRREGLRAGIQPVRRAAPTGRHRQALAQRPQVILADEPVASLDPPTSHVVMRDLQRINRELGIDDRQPPLPRPGNRLRRPDHRPARRLGRLRRSGSEADATVFENIYGRSLTADDTMDKEAAGL